MRINGNFHPQLDRPQVRYAFLLKTLPDPDLLGMPITERCRILGVSPSGYYEWRNRQLGCPRQKTYQAERSKINDETIVMTIRRIRKDLGYTPGLELGRGRGISNLDKKNRITRLATLI